MTEVRRRLVEEAEADEGRDDEGIMVLGDVAETVSLSSPETAATVFVAPSILFRKGSEPSEERMPWMASMEIGQSKAAIGSNARGFGVASGSSSS